MDILSKLPFMNDTSDNTEVDEAEAKRERIAFHRRSVRNGPTNFKTLTSGQVRRARKRALATQARKERRHQIKAYLRQQQEAAVIRGHLQAAGVLTYVHESTVAAPEQIVQSISWLVSHFTPVEPDGDGRVRLTEKVVVDSLTAALNRWQDIVGTPRTPLSPAYVLPVQISA